jgi:intracellular sulfur oxidation DsrE/DsrF family protein
VAYKTIQASRSFPEQLLVIFFALLLTLGPACHAESLNEDKPFAERHLVLQLSDADAAHQKAVLNISNNLIRHYGGPDFIDIQVVVFGPGVLLLADKDNTHSKRIRSLMDNGVSFKICQNTLDSMESESGQAFSYLSGVEVVRSGVAHILDEVDRGYVLVRP